MANNLTTLSNASTQTCVRRGFPEPLSPVEKGLELLAKYTFLDIRESSHIPVGRLKETIFPLIIFYARRYGDSNSISVRIRTSQNRVVYCGPYMPVYRAFSYAHKLQAIFRRNQYGCDVTKEIVEDFPVNLNCM